MTFGQWTSRRRRGKQVLCHRLGKPDFPVEMITGAAIVVVIVIYRTIKSKAKV